ncbi:MAG: peptidase glycoprotease [Chloroflexi bacterium]|nr:peptidase glycoprotease [Chloroflexota bacterium]
MDAAVILAIDTSGATASVAVYSQRVLAELAWHSGRSHSAQTLPAIDAVLRLANVDKRQVSAIAVASGPGSYSGLRVGASTAMAMAMALEISAVQVPTLDVIAWSQCSTSGGDQRTDIRPIRAAIDVGRGHYASARFRRGASQLERETRIESAGLGELLELATAERSVLAVDLDPASRERADQNYGARLNLVSPAAGLRRAGFLAELAAHRIGRGELAPSAILEPIYAGDRGQVAGEK